MYAPPIAERLRDVFRHRATLERLIAAGWKDKQIAGNLGTDKHTIKRARAILAEESSS